MKTNFSEHIKTLRKQQHITQEQLAEAMGVSAGAVYKWEQGISTPDITLIMELASFFGVSVDALVGYVMYSSDRERILQKLKQIKLDKSYADCWADIEGWLKRYPNDFEVVHSCGVLYNLASIETGDQKQILRSIELLSHACTLIHQNRDPKLSETDLHRDIAIGYLTMGKWDKGMDQLKRNNPCGVNDDLIGHELATNPQHRNDAIPYLTNALLHCTASLYRIVIGFVNLFFAQNDYPSAIEILRWFIAYVDGLRTEHGASYLDKDSAMLLALCGAVYQQIGDTDNARAYLRKARQIALQFDASPNYTSQYIRYCEHAEPQVAYDNIGSTAMDTVQNVIEEGADGPDDPTLKLWEDICHEA